MKALGTWKGGYQTQLNDGRAHTVTVDLERDEGGDDLGTSALELSVLSLAGCITTIFALVAKKRRLLVESMTIELDAERPHGAPTIVGVDGVLHVVTRAPPEEVTIALGITMRTCPVGVLFDQAGIPVRVRAQVMSPLVAQDSTVKAAVPNEASPGRSHPAHGGSAGTHLAGRAWTREEALATLERPDRRQYEDPDGLWRRLGLAAGATVVDVGAGTGYFAIAAAKRVGPSGRVFAVDLSEQLVELLRERREKEGLRQLIPLRSTLEEIPLDAAVADVVLFANVLHDVPPSTVSEAVRLLKADGRFVNIDWKKQASPQGPPLEIRLTPEEATRVLARHGLEEIDRWEFGPRHYALLLRRSRSTTCAEGESP